MGRTGNHDRTTTETEVSTWVDVDGSGRAEVDTGYSFLNHIISSLARHSRFDITLRAVSRDNITHHTIEDAAISLGAAISGALGERSGIARFGHAIIPMDDSLARASVDLVKRPYRVVELSLDVDATEGIPREDMVHFFTSLLDNMAACVHIRVEYGCNDHHKIEAATKALAAALRIAVSPDDASVPSTKGSMM